MAVGSPVYCAGAPVFTLGFDDSEDELEKLSFKEKPPSFWDWPGASMRVLENYEIEALKVLLQEKADPNEKRGEITPLFQVLDNWSDYGDNKDIKTTVRILIEHKADINGECLTDTAMIAAARKANQAMVEFLLTVGADQNKTVGAKHPLTESWKHNNDQLVFFNWMMSKYKALPKEVGTELLQYAIGKGHKNIVWNLINDCKVDPNVGINNYLPPILQAISVGHEIVIAMLMVAGADLTIKDDLGRDLAEIYLQSFKQEKEPERKAGEKEKKFFAAIEKGDRQVFDQMLGSVAFDKINDQGQTPLAAAIINEQIKMALSLLLCGASMQAPFGGAGTQKLFDRYRCALRYALYCKLQSPKKYSLIICEIMPRVFLYEEHKKESDLIDAILKKDIGLATSCLGQPTEVRGISGFTPIEAAKKTKQKEIQKILEEDLKTWPPLARAIIVGKPPIYPKRKGTVPTVYHPPAPLPLTDLEAIRSYLTEYNVAYESTQV